MTQGRDALATKGDGQASANRRVLVYITALIIWRESRIF